MKASVGWDHTMTRTAQLCITLALCIRYFSFALIRCHDQNSFQEGLFLLMDPKIYSKQQTWQQERKPKVTSPAQSMKNEALSSQNCLQFLTSSSMAAAPKHLQTAPHNENQIQMSHPLGHSSHLNLHTLCLNLNLLSVPPKTDLGVTGSFYLFLYQMWPFWINIFCLHFDLFIQVVYQGSLLELPEPRPGFFP